MADMYSYNGVKLAKVPVMHEGCKYGIIFYDEEDKCYYWFCSSEKFFLNGNQYMIPASATWGGNASREGAGYWSTAVFTPEESVETPDYYIVAHTGNITWSSVDICQKDTETVAYRTTKPLQYPTISFTGNSKLYYVNAEPENLVCKATVNDGGTLSWAWYEGDVVVSTESLLTPPTDTVGEKTYFCVVTNDTEGQKLKTTSKTVTIRVREFFPLRECINWLLPGLCSRPLPVGATAMWETLFEGEITTSQVDYMIGSMSGILVGYAPLFVDGEVIRLTVNGLSAIYTARDEAAYVIGGEIGNQYLSAGPGTTIIDDGGDYFVSSYPYGVLGDTNFFTRYPGTYIVKIERALFEVKSYD